jgi:4-hydroxy-2-oxoheptanedioate aldolase
MADRLNRLEKALHDGQTLIGFTNTLTADGVAEAVAALGLGFLWIDAQHGHHTSTTARAAAREAQAVGLLAAVRVPGHEYGLLGPFLDTGAEGIIVPMAESTEQAADIVRATRFAPSRWASDNDTLAGGPLDHENR